jgi:hypothetical protein
MMRVYIYEQTHYYMFHAQTLRCRRPCRTSIFCHQSPPSQGVNQGQADVGLGVADDPKPVQRQWQTPQQWVITTPLAASQRSNAISTMAIALGGMRHIVASSNIRTVFKLTVCSLEVVMLPARRQPRVCLLRTQLRNVSRSLGRHPRKLRSSSFIFDGTTNEDACELSSQYKVHLCLKSPGILRSAI